MQHDALKKLHCVMLDTQKGYEVAVRDAETPQLKSFFETMVQLREKDHGAIHKALASMGEHPDDSGSFMAAVHKAATSARATLTGLDDNALSPFISGEENIIKEYDAALLEAFGDAGTSSMLREQKDTLLAKIAEMKAVKTAGDAV